MPVLNVNALIDQRVEAIRHYHDNASIGRAELDLSGGIDSAVMAGLLAVALGADKLTMVYSSINSSSETQARAEDLAAALGARLVVHDLTPTYEAMITDMVNNLDAAGFDRAAIEARIKASAGVFKGPPGARCGHSSANASCIALRMRPTISARASPWEKK